MFLYIHEFYKEKERKKKHFKDEKLGSDDLNL